MKREIIITIDENQKIDINAVGFDVLEIIGTLETVKQQIIIEELVALKTKP